MEVYVVTWNLDRETSVSKVFDSEEKAKEFCEREGRTMSWAYYSYEKFEVE